MRPRFLTVIVFLLIAHLGAPAAQAYTILLDSDVDDDPATVNESTTASEATVRIILQPTELDEWITEIRFVLGGTCWECDPVIVGFGYYGTAWDLWWDGQLPEFPQFIAHTSCVTSFLCQGNPGGPCQFYAYSPEGFTLNEPVFVATFQAWVAESPHQDCELPPSDLMTFPDGGVPGNTIMLADGGVIDTGASSLTAIKGLFR